MRRTLVGLGVVTIFSSVTAFAAPTAQPPATVAAIQLNVPGISTLFRQCSEIGTETEVIEQTDPKSPTTVTKIPGRTTAPNIVCTRAFSTETTLAAWRKQVEDGVLSSAIRSGSIVLLDDQFTEIARFNFTHGWPNYLKLNAVDSTTGGTLTETISIVVDDINRP